MSDFDLVVVGSEGRVSKNDFCSATVCFFFQD
jgi:hypothetical protein